MDSISGKRNPIAVKLMSLVCFVIFLGVPIAYSQGLPDRRDYGLVYAVLMTIGDITKGQLDYRAANTESVRTYLHEKISVFRDQLSEFQNGAV